MVGRIELLGSQITSSLAGSTSLASQLECFHASERAAVWAALQDLDVARMAATGEDAAARAHGALSTTAEVVLASGLRAGAGEDDEQAHP